MNAEPRERGILYQPHMVRALLRDVDPKWQTRRLIKNTTKVCAECFSAGVPHNDGDGGAGVFGRDPYLRVPYCDHTTYSGGRIRCPYGVVGDRLWMRETWRPKILHGHGTDTCDCDTLQIEYPADGGWIEFAAAAVAADWTMPKAAARGNVSPLFLPRWASRLTHELTAVRIQRVQDITREDAIAEGWTADPIPTLLNGKPAMVGFFDPLAWYRALWVHINGAESWKANPFVWALSFRRAEERAA